MTDQTNNPPIDPIQVLRELVEDNPNMSEKQLRKEFLGLMRNDPRLQRAVFEDVFSDLWKKEFGKVRGDK